MLPTTRPPARPPRLVDSVIELGAREGLLDVAPTWCPPRPTHDELHRELLPPPREPSIEGGSEGQGDEGQREGDAQHADTMRTPRAAEVSER